jgi:dihydroorotate dehydrogenase (NAD+) catalytic subunit
MNLSVNIAGVTLKNPIMPASGTFGNGSEYAKYVDLNQLGAVVTKGVSIKPWQGNPPPRIVETASGALNSVGLQNPGVESFLENDLPFLKQFDTKIIVNICGHTVSEYTAVAEALDSSDIDFIELNISCPNISEGGLSFGSSSNMVELVVLEVKRHIHKPLIVKLSPNVTDIAEIAKTAEAAGADALSLINTVLGMKIDVRKRAFSLANKTGGLSGPAIKPIAVRMVYQVSRAVKIPIIGMGGIMTGEDAIEFLLAGATAVAVGTANFYRLDSCVHILKEINLFMQESKISNIKDCKNLLR